MPDALRPPVHPPRPPAFWSPSRTSCSGNLFPCRSMGECSSRTDPFAEGPESAATSGALFCTTICIFSEAFLICFFSASLSRTCLVATSVPGSRSSAKAGAETILSRARLEVRHCICVATSAGPPEQWRINDRPSIDDCRLDDSLRRPPSEKDLRSPASGQSSLVC